MLFVIGGANTGKIASRTHWNFSGLGPVNDRLVLKWSVSGRKSWYLSVHAWRLSDIDDRLRCGASDCRRTLPPPAKLALVGAVVGAAVPPSTPTAVL